MNRQIDGQIYDTHLDGQMDRLKADKWITDR